MDFGQESVDIINLFKSDYGSEPEIWEDLEKARNLTEAIAAKQGTSPSVAAPEKPPTVAPVKPPPQPTTPNPPTSNVGGLANRLGGISAIKNHPLVRGATTRLNKLGIRVEDNMPAHYTPEIRAQAMDNVANGVDFLHKQFPGMEGIHRQHGMTYNFQGPQIVQGGGQLMGQYHEPGSKGNTETTPKIELNATAEQTLWHEHAHFLDHVMSGMQPRGSAITTRGHPMRALVREMQMHPVHMNQSNRELQAAVRSGDQDKINHVLYK